MTGGRRTAILAPLVLVAACGGGDADLRYRVDSGSGVALVFREADQGPAAMDAASASGAFERRGDCLVVEVAGAAKTPVFPVPARYDGEARAVAMGGRSYALGRLWQFEFASAGEGPKALANASALPRACPRDFFYFGGIAERGE